MIATDKLIICVATCGSFLGKEANPNIPTNPKEIAEEVYRSWNEGASLAHIHARDKEGMATTNLEVFGEIAGMLSARNVATTLERKTVERFLQQFLCRLRSLFTYHISDSSRQCNSLGRVPVNQNVSEFTYIIASAGLGYKKPNCLLTSLYLSHSP